MSMNDLFMSDELRRMLGFQTIEEANAAHEELLRIRRSWPPRRVPLIIMREKREGNNRRVVWHRVSVENYSRTHMIPGLQSICGSVNIYLREIDDFEMKSVFVKNISYPFQDENEDRTPRNLWWDATSFTVDSPIKLCKKCREHLIEPVYLSGGVIEGGFLPHLYWAQHRVPYVMFEYLGHSRTSDNDPKDVTQYVQRAEFYSHNKNCRILKIVI